MAPCRIAGFRSQNMVDAGWMDDEIRLDRAEETEPSDIALLAAPSEKEGNEKEQKGKPMTCSGHGEGASPHAMPEQYAESQP